jgi:hypothetical protein
MKFYPADWRADAMLRLCSIGARGLWAEMMCLMHAADNYGSLLVNGRRIDKKQLAGLAGISEKECIFLLLELETNGVFSRDEDGTIYSRRMRRDHAKAIKDKENGRGGGNPTLKAGVNPPDNPTDNGGDKAQKPEARSQRPEKKETREDALSYDFEFADFWNLWPNKVGKPAALKAFVGARKRAGLDAIVNGVFAYIRDKPPDRAWLNPATFLNQNRWDDQPAQVQHGRTQETRQSLPEAARRLAEQGLSFGPKPELPTLRSITGGADVRLLPQSGCERPGDIRGGGGGGPERLSAGSDRLHHGPEDGAAEQITVVAERVRG